MKYLVEYKQCECHPMPLLIGKLWGIHCENFFSILTLFQQHMTVSMVKSDNSVQYFLRIMCTVCTLLWFNVAGYRNLFRRAKAVIIVWFPEWELIYQGVISVMIFQLFGGFFFVLIKILIEILVINCNGTCICSNLISSLVQKQIW